MHLRLLTLFVSVLLPAAAAAQTDFRGTASLGTGGGGPAFVREVDAIFLNPANLAFQERGSRAVVTFGRVAGRLGGDLLQANFYNDYLTGGRLLTDRETTAMLDDWFGNDMRAVRNSGEAVLAAFTVHGHDRGYGGAIRLRSYVEGRLNRGIFDLILNGMEENRTIPIDAAVNSFSAVDLSVGIGFRKSPDLTIGFSPKLVMGLGHTSGEFNSELHIDDYSLTHEFDYRFRTAGADASIAAEVSPFAEQTYGEESTVRLDLGAAGFGAGVDAGATYRFSDNIDLAASITDLGFVRWSKNARTVTPAGSDFRLEELEVDRQKLDEQYDGAIGEYMTDAVDSLAEASYGQVNTDEGAFVTSLPTALHLGGSLQKGMATFTGGISAGLAKTGGFVRMPATYLGTELRLGSRSLHVPLRAGVRFGGRRAMGLSGGIGLHTPVYDLDIGAALTPYSTLLGRGAQVAVSTAALTIRI